MWEGLTTAPPGNARFPRACGARSFWLQKPEKPDLTKVDKNGEVKEIKVLQQKEKGGKRSLKSSKETVQAKQEDSAPKKEKITPSQEEGEHLPGRRVSIVRLQEPGGRQTSPPGQDQAGLGEGCVGGQDNHALHPAESLA